MSSAYTGKPKFDHSKVESVRLKEGGTNFTDVVIDLPTEEIPAASLPSVTVITLTRNRKEFFPLAIDNWRRIEYPYDKLTWLVVDDSDTAEQSPVRLLKQCNDKRIKFYHMEPNRELIYPRDANGGKICGPPMQIITPSTIGAKRNKGCELAERGHILVMMDDDDYLYKQSILVRVTTLLFYKKLAVYSDQLGVYNVYHENSHILEGFSDVPEGSMAFFREWWEKQKFGETSQREGEALVEGRELSMIKLPWSFNLIVIQHRRNFTGLARNIRHRKGEIEKRISIGESLNFKDEFDAEFWKLLHSINELKTK